MKVWGQLLWAPPKAVPHSPPQCSPHSGSSAKAEAVKSAKFQTPVGMEQLELFGLGRGKADFLCQSLMGVRPPPTRKPAMGFVELQDVTNSGFPCLIRKSGLSMFTLCHAFLGCYISREVGQGVQGALQGWDVLGTDICSSSSCCLMRLCAFRVWMQSHPCSLPALLEVFRGVILQAEVCAG